MDYKEQVFYDAHPTALPLTSAGNYEIKFFSGYVANVRTDAWQVEFQPDEDFSCCRAFVSVKSPPTRKPVARSRPGNGLKTIMFYIERESSREAGSEEDPVELNPTLPQRP